MGDLNGVAIPGQAQFEFEALLQLPYRDVLEALNKPIEERATHYYFNPKAHFNQLDYIFCTNDLAVVQATTVVPFVPETQAERAWLPSDHCFLSAQLTPC
jgi:endonuclease/exonuclease/phosphatase family metal-dependent hydrolase